MSDILTIGHPALARVCDPVHWPDPALADELAALHQALAGFRERSGFGRAIAAPQLGIPKRAIALNLGASPFAVINPHISWRSEDTFEVWDDCLSVPQSVVRVRRHRSVSIHCLDDQGRARHWQHLPPDLSELLQHEIDHLDGVLMVDRAIGGDSIRPIAERDSLVGNARPRHRLSLDAIAQAARTIDPVFAHSPQYECGALSKALAVALTLKVETANPIRSFKGRGADYFVMQAHMRGDTRPLVCASAGNFGQALAYACANHDRQLTVFASRHANPLKLSQMRATGADVKLAGEDFDAAKDAARRHARRTDAWMVEDGREPEISEGAGTIAVELLARGDAFDAVLVPLGNGALLNGIARWVKAASPATRVLGVSAAGASAMEKSWRSGAIVQLDAADTIADGIAVRVPVPEAVTDMGGLVDDVLLVEDMHILHAMQLLYSDAGLVAEPAGAAGVAAIVANPALFKGQRLATVVCGSNMTWAQARSWLDDET